MLQYLQTHKQTVKHAIITINDLTLSNCYQQGAVSALTAAWELAIVTVLIHPCITPIYAVEDTAGT